MRLRRKPGTREERSDELVIPTSFDHCNVTFCKWNAGDGCAKYRLGLFEGEVMVGCAAHTMAPPR